jgi:hypothetical protein
MAAESGGLFRRALQAKERHMFSNVGMIDRLVRLVIGAALITAPLINFMGLGASAAVTYLMIAIGVILGVTAVFGICPLYKLMGVSTKS